MAEDGGLRSYDSREDKTPPEYLHDPQHDQDIDGSRRDDANHCCQHPQPLLDIHKGRSIRLQVRVLVPVKDHPNFNFVGKLLGPKGNSLKRLQEDTQTKMAILGRGSMRDKAKEEELRNLGDPKHSHLNEELHVEVTAFAPAAEAYSRMAHALAEVKRFLVPDYYDDIRQNQLRELALLNGDRKKAKLDSGETLESESFEETPPTTAPPNGVTPRPPMPPFVTTRPAPPPTPRVGGPRLTSSNLRNSPTSGRMATAISRPSLVRSFVCSGGQRVVFRKPSNIFCPSSGESPRVQYLQATDENGFSYEPDDYGSETSEVVAEEFPRLRTAPFMDYEEQLQSDGDIYESNGFLTKDYIAEDWASTVRSATNVPVGRLKSAHPTAARPILRNNYREHPYLAPRF